MSSPASRARTPLPFFAPSIVRRPPPALGCFSGASAPLGRAGTIERLALALKFLLPAHKLGRLNHTLRLRRDDCGYPCSVWMQRRSNGPAGAFLEDGPRRASRLPRPVQRLPRDAQLHTPALACACAAQSCAVPRAPTSRPARAAGDTRGEAPEDRTMMWRRRDIDNTRAGGRRHLHADERRGPRVPRGRRDRLGRRPPDQRQQHRDERRRADQPRRGRPRRRKR